MAVNLIGYSEREQNVYEQSPEVQKTIDQVVRMMQDLGVEMDVLFSLIDEEEEDQYSLAFSGSTMSLDFCPHAVRVVDFDLDTDDIEVVAEFPLSQINGAVLCLINRTQANLVKPFS